MLSLTELRKRIGRRTAQEPDEFQEHLERLYCPLGSHIGADVPHWHAVVLYRAWYLLRFGSTTCTQTSYPHDDHGGKNIYVILLFSCWNLGQNAAQLAPKKLKDEKKARRGQLATLCPAWVRLLVTPCLVASFLNDA